jgi:small subunit ribosomal protein S4
LVEGFLIFSRSNFTATSSTFPGLFCVPLRGREHPVANVTINERETVSTKSRTRSKTRLSRALGIALTPKAAKYLEKRPYAPGEHGRTKRKADSDYAVRLREKQRLRAQYGIREAQLKIAFQEARRSAGLTGENLVELLEMRLDALVLRAGFARTTAQARQMVVHRHILVDGQLVDRPSFRVKPGQLIHVKERSEGMEPFQVAAAGGHVDVLPKTPAYLEVELDKLHARLVRRPKRAEVPVTCEVQLVVEYYAAR